MSESNFWGDLIKTLREEQGISQRVLADQTGINRGTLRKIENGTTCGDMNLIERALDYLGYELEAMAKGTPTQQATRSSREENPERRARQAAQRVLLMKLT